MVRTRSERWLQGVAEDHHSGATALTRRAGEALLAFLGERPDASGKELERFGERLAEAQPAMASIRNLVRRALEAARQGGLPAARAAVQAFLKELEQSPARLAERALSLMPKGARVLTISYSSAVFTTLKRAHEQGKELAVVCQESRPLREGLRLAQRLAALGVTVEVCVDALAPALVESCDLVLVGGDALAPEGLVNKCGTYALALAASSQKKTFVALVSALKFLERFERAWVQAMPPEEVLDVSTVRGPLSVRNLYFDLTPLGLLTHAVTESEVLTMEELRRRFSS